MRPAERAGTSRSKSLLPARGCEMTLGGAFCAHFIPQPRISASTCRSKTTGMPSGEYSLWARLSDSNSLAPSLRSSVAVLPVRLPMCTPV
jgi:hypothetical protein